MRKREVQMTSMCSIKINHYTYIFFSGKRIYKTNESGAHRVRTIHQCILPSVSQHTYEQLGNNFVRLSKRDSILNADGNENQLQDSSHRYKLCDMNCSRACFYALRYYDQTQKFPFRGSTMPSTW